MRLLMEEGREAVRIWCCGDLDVTGARSLLRTCDGLSRHGRPVLLDVGGIATVDVVGAAFLARYVRRLREKGLPAVVVAAHPELRETLELMGGADVLGRDALGRSPGPP